MGGGGGREWWKRSSVGLACRVGEDCARRARAGEEDQIAQESKLDPSSNASVRSYGFSLEQWIVTVADREDRDRYLRTISNSMPHAGIPTSALTAKRRRRQQLPVTLKKWWPWWLLLPGCLASWTRYVEEYDSIRVARCDARCGENHSDECVENCLASNYTKPGYCPERMSMTPFEAACLIACIDDSRCPDLAKCCSHDCGITCMHPVGLDSRNDLPVIPENLQIQQQKRNLVLLTWRNSRSGISNVSANDNDRDVRYLVEERHLVGPRFIESRLSSWTVCHVSTKPHATLRSRLKTGHWYQFRVAAVNGNGSRGYSQPSRPFKTKEPRNPKEPQNLTLSNARLIGGKLRINLRWIKPTSDVPISFYKIFWSRFIHGPTNDSILVYHKTILKDKTCYELKNLELKCQYFLQVQAVAMYGGRRLTSRKASKVFNSTDYMAYADIGRRSRRCERTQAGLHVRRMNCHCGEIKARLVWPTSSDASMYNITWQEESCSRKKGPEHRRKSNSWKVVQASHYDLRQLQNDCMYSVNVRNILKNSENIGHGTSIEFFATGCQDDQKQRKYSRRKTMRCKTKSSRSTKQFSGLFVINK
ncbi:PREDICTED: anosmin-1 [Trachymyrmex cornetzi]|uniref:anosmin-1 n=1 Tax=Trachymyrmex cornetzi TaxID=471704 RepID=UPI00084F22C5|nr:PREDICTED: anosmin-1 [Trachymyrmex cornetzi]